MDYDLKIVGGTIIDGSGRERVRGDVAVKDGRVVALGEAPGQAREVIEAEGQVVSPGFVDVHTHYDAQVFWDSTLSVSPWHGVTTVVIGNCGFGIAPTRPDHRGLILETLARVETMSLDSLWAGLGRDWPFVTFAEYLTAIERRRPAVNVAVLAGHTPIRLNVMGAEAVERTARPDEVAAMKALVREAIDAGAIGFATSVSNVHFGFSGRPVPSRLASFDEIVTLCQAMTDAGRGLIHYNVGRQPRFDEYEALVRATGRPLCWTSLLSGGLGPGAHRDHLAQAHAQQAKGLDIHPQGAARPITLEITFRLPSAFDTWENFAPVRAAKGDEALKAIYRDPSFRQRFRDEIDDRGQNWKHFPGQRGEWIGNLASWRELVVSWFPPDSRLNERRLSAIAKERRVHEADLILDLALESSLVARFRMPRVNFNEAEVAEIMADPAVVIGLGDGGAHLSQLCDACYSTHVLGHWVRGKGVLTLEQAIHRLAYQTAQVYGIVDRGLLACGRAADIVVFDPKTVGAGPLERVYDLPGGADRLVSRPHGIGAVIVNGRPLPAPGEETIEGPGRLLRHGRAT
ncbi:MAG: amidohydrolase family protein [Alphaproteobacteria bacterium]|nr:amidohydrolase family protein [Alphaproteobacteria bacterium]